MGVDGFCEDPDTCEPVRDEDETALVRLEANVDVLATRVRAEVTAAGFSVAVEDLRIRFEDRDDAVLGPTMGETDNLACRGVLRLDSFLGVAVLLTDIRSAGPSYVKLAQEMLYTASDILGD